MTEVTDRPDGGQAALKHSLLDLGVGEVGSPLPMCTPNTHAASPHTLHVSPHVK